MATCASRMGDWVVGARQGPARRPPGGPGARRQVRPAGLHRARPSMEGFEPHAGSVRPRGRRALHRLADDFETPDCPRWMISGRGRPGGPRRPALGRRRAPGERPSRALARGLRADRRDPQGPQPAAARAARRGRRARVAGRPPHHRAGHDPRCHSAHQPRRGARGSGQRQDRARPHPGQGAHARQARDAGAAGRAPLLLRRARQLVQAVHGHRRPQAPPGIRRDLRGARGLPGRHRVRRARRH